VVAAVDHRVIGVHDHGAAGGVLPAERALWSAQYFDAGDIVVRLFLEVARESAHAVAVRHHPDGGLRIVLRLADAADIEIDALTEVVDGRAGCGELQLIDRHHPQLGQLGAAQDRCSDRRILKIRVAAFRGDHDLRQNGLSRIVRRRRVGRLRHSGAATPQRHR